MSGNGGNQGGRGYEGNYPPYQQNQQQQYPNMQYNYTMNQPYAGNMPNMAYPDQYYMQQGPYQGYGQEAYEEHDYDNLDEIDRELNKDVPFDYEDQMMQELEGMNMSPAAYGHKSYNNGGYSPARNSAPYVPQSAMPSQNGKLSAHAGEFWFPECRNCPCCKGFKHGCDCCKANGVDTCKDPACIDGAFESQVSAELATRSAATSAPAPAAAPAAVPTTESAAPAAPAAAPVTTSTNEATQPASVSRDGSADNLCKFERSPGGCRFGAGCRFQHMSPPVSISSAYPPAPPAQHQQGNAQGSSRCAYFARGSCQYGETCRFGHY